MTLIFILLTIFCFRVNDFASKFPMPGHEDHWRSSVQSCISACFWNVTDNKFWNVLIHWLFVALDLFQISHKWFDYGDSAKERQWLDVGHSHRVHWSVNSPGVTHKVHYFASNSLEMEWDTNWFWSKGPLPSIHIQKAQEVQHASTNVNSGAILASNSIL